MMAELLSREQFREQVLNRDSGKCVMCDKPAVDAHHIIDRALWDNGGYYLQNGVSLCEYHHWGAEMTIISCDLLREKIGVTQPLLPDHFYRDQSYDKWGNIKLPNGTRIKGEMLGNKSVIDLLKKAGVWESFVPYVKFPRTYHLPWSPNLQNDDRMHENAEIFLNREIVATVKMDGENTTMYKDYIHARSVDSKHHESRNWVKALHGQIAHDIPKGYRICGENMYAEHSIHYNNLETYFYVFSIWNENNVALSWDSTVEWCSLLGLKHVPVFFRGIWNKDDIHESFLSFQNESLDPVEGYVIRLTDDITYRDYRKYYAKWVKKDFIQTDDHWMKKAVIENELS